MTVRSIWKDVEDDSFISLKGWWIVLNFYKVHEEVLL